jgi:hypothetical protein
MTEQLMEDLTNEEHEALLLMSEHGIAAPLSPAAQAVLNGFRAVPTLMDGPSIAAALRAAADQVRHHWDGMECVNYLCAIAAELEAL